jgi:LuxR family maltose regulon positive regulatory protein
MLEYYEQKISSSHEDELIQGIVVTLRGPVTLHTTMDAPEVRKFTKQALEILPEDAYLVRGIAMGHYGSASLLLGELDVATSYLQDAIRMIEYTQQWPVVYVFRNYLAEVIAVKGELHRAADYFKKIYTHAHKRDVYNVFYSANLIGLGMIYYEWNLLEEAQRYIEDGLQYIKSDKTIDRLLYAASACFRLDLANNELSKFETFINEIEEIAAKYDYPLRVIERIDSYHSLIALEKGEINKAARWANIYAQHHKDDITCMRQREWLAVIRIWLKTGNESEAIKVLNKVHQLAYDEGRMRNWVTISVILSKAYGQIGERDKAISALQAAIETAEPEGYIRSFLDEGEPIRNLLGEILENNPSSPLKQYMQRLLDAFPGEDYSKWKNPLTPREVDVVRLLSQGLTYDQIANELTISLNTLKYHIKNIFSKLDVHNRTEAVLIAKKFELI